MKARLIILIVVACALAVSFAMRSSGPPREDPELKTYDGDDDKTAEQREAEQKMLWENPLPGEEPPEKADLSADVQVDTSSGKNRLMLYITEAHGYYVETIHVRVWYKGGDDVTGPEDSPLSFLHRMNRFVKANETLTDCFEAVPVELARIGGNIGETANWEAEVVYYGRAREQNPDPLPIYTQAYSCD